MDHQLLIDIVSNEVCNRCDINNTTQTDDRVCAKTAENLVVKAVGVVIDGIPEFADAPDTEPIELDLGGIVPIDTTKGILIDTIHGAVSELGANARRCSTARSRYMLSQHVGRSTEPEFVPVTLYSRQQVINSLIPS